MTHHERTLLPRSLYAKRPDEILQINTFILT